MKKKSLKTSLLSLLFTFALLLPIIPIPSAVAATLDVTTYGANGGDTSDDREAIQDAIDAASAGDTVYFPAGTYYLISGNGLIGKSGIKLEGQNRDTTILRYSSSIDGHMINLSNTSDSEVSHLTLWGNDHTLGGIITENTGANASGNHKFHHLLVKELIMTTGFGPFGIMIANSNDNEISDSEFINMGVGSTWGAAIRAGWNSHRTKVLRNTIDGSGRGAIFLNDGCEDVVVSHNTATRSGLAEHGLSIELHTGCDGGIVEDNHVDHWLSVVRSEYNAIRRNFIGTDNGTVQGMGLEVMSHHSVTTDNTVDNGQQVGIQQSSGSGYQYWGYNTVKNMVMWGMQLQGEGAAEPQQLQYFYKNTFENTQRNNPAAAYPGFAGNAVRIHGNAKNMTFDSNEIINNGRKAIEITTSAGTDSLSFINNIITGNTDASIDQYPASASNLEWSNNTVSGNGTNTQLTSRGFSNPKPTANFTAPGTVQLGQSVTFTNTSSDNNSIVENLWDFGEGAPSTTVSPTYTYEEAGTYRVTLVVWDNEGRASLKEQTIYVNAGPPDTEAPSAPSNLTSPSKTGTTVDLSWNASTDNVGVVGYDIYVNGVFEDSTSGTTFTVTGLTESTQYDFTVKAKDAADNNSAASSVLSVTTNVSPLVWEHCAGENNQCSFSGTKDVRYGANGSYAYGTYTDGVMCSNNTFGDPAPGYYKTCDVAEATGSGSDTVAPSIPTNLSSPSKTSTTVDLSWSASTDNVSVTGYDIYKDGVLEDSTSGTTYTVTNLSANTEYDFTVKAKDAASNESAASTLLSVTTDASGGGETTTGSITREYWTGITGDTVASVPVNTTPFGTSTLTSFKAPTNFGDNYGTRIRGYIVPSTSGTYTFSIAGDNNSVLYLSTDDNPANKVQLGYVIDWVNEESWNTHAYQTSGSISLVANERYYVEVLHKEAVGGDHVAVGWTGPGIASTTVIPGTNLAPFE